MSRARTRAPSTALQSRQGSASAVVVLVTVLLAVFGVLALVSSYSGYRLALRHAAWTTSYYAVDRDAEAARAAIEADLAAAARTAGSVSASGAFPDLAAAALAQRVPASQGTIARDAGGFTVRVLVQGAEAQGQYVRMELRVDFADGPVPARLCRVVSWRQWQKPFDYKPYPGDLWGGGS